LSNYSDAAPTNNARHISRKLELGCNKILGGALPSRPLPVPSLVFPSLSSHCPPFPYPSLSSRPPLIQLGGLGGAVSSPSGVWGGAPAENDFGAF